MTNTEKYIELCNKALWVEEDTLRKKAEFIEGIFKGKIAPILKRNQLI